MITHMECHGHIMMDGVDFSRAKARHKEHVDEGYVRSVLTCLRDSGVVYYRDGGDSLGVGAFAGSICGEYGIEVVSPVFAIYKKGRYGSILGRGYTDLNDYRQLVSEVRNAGGNFIKLVVSGILDLNEYGRMSCESIESEEIRQLIHIAHSEGMPVMVHADSDQAVRASLDADSIEHGYYTEDETVSAMAESGTVFVPTLLPVYVQKGRSGTDSSVVDRILERHMELIRKASEAGVDIACGSDAGSFGVLQQNGAVLERGLLRKCGLSDELIDRANTKVRNIFRAEG